MEKLKEIRTQKGMTQQEVAKKLNITQATYSGYESDKYEPSIDILISISKLFKVSIDYLVNNENKFSIDLSNLSDMKKELLQDILNLDEVDCIYRWREMKDHKEWEQDNPQEADEMKQRRIQKLEEEKEHFKRLLERTEQQEKERNKKH